MATVSSSHFHQQLQGCQLTPLIRSIEKLLLKFGLQRLIRETVSIAHWHGICGEVLAILPFLYFKGPRLCQQQHNTKRSRFLLHLCLKSSSHLLPLCPEPLAPATIGDSQSTLRAFSLYSPMQSLL